jgi:S-adenosylmethionine-diacylglycerol 3-amino-3-carboxypropyl transferase
MSTSETNGQVKLSKLIFTHNWEDPAIDERALQIKSGDTVFTITSGGCNTLGFLRFDPKQIFCVDINEAQTHLMELKQACFRNLDYEELIAFFGLSKHPNRMTTFEKIKKDLSRKAVEFWNSQERILSKGIIMNGRYERFVKIAGWLLRTMQGRAKTNSFFALRTLDSQKQFYDQQWNNRRWKWIFDTMFNKKRLAAKGLNADYFHFDDGSSSFSESFQRRAAHAMSNLPVRENYFLALYLKGSYLDNNLPEYLKPENFVTIKTRIDNVVPVTADSKYWLMDQPENLFQAMALSNICELMDDRDTLKLFQEVKRTASPGARLVFRNLMVPREVPQELDNKIVKNEILSRELQYADRSFVYGKVAAYQIVK